MSSQYKTIFHYFADIFKNNSYIKFEKVNHTEPVYEKDMIDIETDYYLEYKHTGDTEYEYWSIYFPNHSSYNEFTDPVEPIDYIELFREYGNNCPINMALNTMINECKPLIEKRKSNLIEPKTFNEGIDIACKKAIKYYDKIKNI